MEWCRYVIRNAGSSETPSGYVNVTNGRSGPGVEAGSRKAYGRPGRALDAGETSLLFAWISSRDLVVDQDVCSADQV